VRVMSQGTVRTASTHDQAHRTARGYAIRLGASRGRPIGNYQLVGARQTLQWVGQIKIGSSAQALYQTPNFRRHGKRSGTMPALSSSPTSKSQFSGASWMGSHFNSPTRHRLELEGACNKYGNPPLEVTDLSERVLPF
jgi:hypothetical protein